MGISGAVTRYLNALAGRYARKGFLVAAARIYLTSDPPRAKAIYRALARRAARSGFHLLAMELYEASGNPSMAGQARARAVKSLHEDGMPALAAEVAQEGSRKSSMDSVTQKYVDRAIRLERRGEFRRAKLHWARAARRRERQREFESAARLYSSAGLVKKAEQAFRRCPRSSGNATRLK